MLSLWHGLAVGWRLLTAWRKAELPARAHPLTLLQLQALAALGFAHGHSCFAVLMLVAYHCLLRTGEILSVRFEDLSFVAGNSKAVLQLGYTNSSKRRGEQESVIVDDRDLVVLLRAFANASCGQGHIYLGMSAAFRKVFKEGVEALGLSSSDFKPYSIGRGGATYLFQLSFNMSLVAARGRWQNQKIARIHADDAQVELSRIAGTTAQAEARTGWNSKLAKLIKNYLQLGSPASECGWESVFASAFLHLSHI